MNVSERTAKRNRRVSPRRSPKGATRVSCRRGCLGLGPNIAVTLLDVSETGARLIVKGALIPGQEIELGLLAPGCVREYSVPGEVVWSVETASGAHCIGVQFEKRLSYSAVQDVGRLPGS